MGFMEEWKHDEGDIRLIVHASTLDLVVYINWAAETVRERRTRHTLWFASWDSWTREGEPIPIGVSYQLKAGTAPPPGSGNPMGPFPSASTGEPGYRAVSIAQLAASVTSAGTGDPSVSTPASLIGSVESMRVEFTHEGKKVQLTVGANWLSKLIAIGVIIVVVMVLVALFWYLVLL